MTKTSELLDKIETRQLEDNTCTCAKCMDGLQVCGYDDLFWVAKWKTEEKPLPKTAHSEKAGIVWEFDDGSYFDGVPPTETWPHPSYRNSGEELYFGYGSTEMEAVLRLIDAESACGGCGKLLKIVNYTLDGVSMCDECVLESLPASVKEE